ncbi:hypothetical protein [Nocardioides ungokensis]|uniref:hypothetical protein n=1 Tax=Nocardioides ungokensis TaxID=1643322 RepID=UPI0015DEBD13|nr:hypothetical protein [Nocardioides ungokensis]
MTLKFSTGNAVIPPGHQLRVIRGDGVLGPTSLLVWATQKESGDDGGSRSPLGTLRYITPGGDFRVDFDVREGTVLPLPMTPWELRVRNCNDDNQPDIEAHAALVSGSRPTSASRTWFLGHGMEQPNIRVPNAARRVFYDLGLPDHKDYRALLSDAMTGETYGLLAPLTGRELDRSTRYVRFMDLPEGAFGTVTFQLSL